MILFWLAVAILAAIGEVLTTGLFLATIAFAAVVIAIVSILLPFFAIQLALFALLSLLGVMVLRPVLVHTLGFESVSHVAGPVVQSYIVGRRAVVTRPVDAHGGQIRVGEGEFWSARAFEPADTMYPGTTVEVMVVDGLTALVTPVPALASPEQDESIATDMTGHKGA